MSPPLVMIDKTQKNNSTLCLWVRNNKALPLAVVPLPLTTLTWCSCWYRIHKVLWGSSGEQTNIYIYIYLIEWNIWSSSYTHESSSKWFWEGLMWVPKRVDSSNHRRRCHSQRQLVQHATNWIDVLKKNTLNVDLNIPKWARVSCW